MPNYILATFDKNKTPPVIAINSGSGFAYLTVNDKTGNDQVDFAALAKKYGLGDPDSKFTLFGYNKDGTANKDYFPWQEINFSSLDPTIRGKYVLVTGQMLDSYTIQAIRNRVILVGPEDTIENAIQGLLVKDGQFILGGRGGTDQAGTLQPVPGGSVGWREYEELSKNKYKPDYIDVFNFAFRAEAEEEAGVKNIENIRLMGIFNQVTKHVNRQWLFKGEPRENIDTIMGNIQDGISFYQQQLAQGKTGREAKLSLRDSGHPIDAWENSDAWSFSYDGDTLLRLLADGHWTNPRGVKMNLIGSLPADLYIAGWVDFGDEFQKEADKLEFVKREVVWPE
ncbi:MAG TPA: hypothetical protein VJC39_03770 [Candidatus Nanoarchaeia archaeon]|nr:hypothetical protein [Candidatus Nanoarchaeia archaeon]